MDLFFNKEGKRAAPRRKKEKKRVLHGGVCSSYKTKKGKERERERDEEEEARDASSSSSSAGGGGLFFTENDDEKKKHEFQDFEREQVLQFLPRSSFWVVVRTSTTKTRFCERSLSGNTRDNIASSSKFQSSREEDRRW